MSENLPVVFTEGPRKLAGGSCIFFNQITKNQDCKGTLTAQVLVVWGIDGTDISFDRNYTIVGAKVITADRAAALAAP